MISEQEIERRKPLWSAFSDLWLDNELQKYEIEHVAQTMKNSGYNFDELERIFFREVAPTVYKNAFSMTGEWAGFDSEWLYRAIVENLLRQETNLFYRTWVNSAPGRFLMTKMVQEDWNNIVDLYKKRM